MATPIFAEDHPVHNHPNNTQSNLAQAHEKINTEAHSGIKHSEMNHSTAGLADLNLTTPKKNGAEHQGLGHAAMGQAIKGQEHPMADHAAVGHSMSDPAMAKAMEADMRNRFFVSLLLTIPVILYSMLGVNLFGLNLPTPFGLSNNWVLLILSSPVVWWGGWMFHSGAYRALRNRTLNMNVLVSLGVLVAYFFSVFVTFLAPQVETSYDAAVMLVTFVLFGHWMEMRSRRGSSDALNALLRLAPTQANRIGPDGLIQTVPVEQL